MTLGENLRNLRVANHVSLRKLSEETGLSISTIWRVENDRHRCHITTLRSISQVLGVKPADLIAASENYGGKICRTTENTERHCS